MCVFVGMYICNRLEGQLEQIEKKHGISCRWKPSDSQYENVRMHLLKEKTVLRIHASLWSSVVKRHYLLRMKAKYAGI